MLIARAAKVHTLLTLRLAMTRAQLCYHLYKPTSLARWN
jgi:hypothetical protein